jgi:hypothetical protein
MRAGFVPARTVMNLALAGGAGDEANEHNVVRVDGKGIGVQRSADIALTLSRCTKFLELRSFIINLFPGFDCRFIALKSRNVALKARTKFR